WPVSVPIVEWRARRWWGLAWVALHAFLMLVVVIVANLCVLVLSEFL
ncbi:MAG: hypothetical protein JNG89_11060, partial [Planctomycetaceae bacterium]|nr:hypothetical protein [Planctomycetaceae bacterium]